MIEAAAMENIIQQKEHKVLAIFGDNRFIEALKYSESCRKDGITVNLINCRDISNPEQYGRQYGYDEILNFD
jgi:bifunctional N-acetylglucosamine-1-phosphate-uridyltransferase/glucosamine-1-phosphate-acetyltransferase GlmU-like protein